MKSLLLLSILFATAANAQDSTATNKNDKKTSKEEYIILKDSSKIAGNVSYKNSKIKLDGKQYDPGDLIGFKVGTTYKVIIGDAIFTVLAMGKINVYSQREIMDHGSTYNTKTNVITHDVTESTTAFMRKDNGPLKYYSSKNLYELIKDNEAAVKEFNLRYKKINDSTPWDFLYNNLKKVVVAYDSNTVTSF